MSYASSVWSKASLAIGIAFLLLSSAGCRKVVKDGDVIDLSEGPAVVDLVAGVQLAFARNKPSDIECKLAGCAKLGQVCKTARASAVAVCTDAHDEALATCAGMDGATATARCERVFLRADGKCRSATEGVAEVCGPYLAVLPPKIKRVSLLLQTKIDGSGMATVSVGVGPIRLGGSGGSVDVDARSMRLDFVAAPPLGTDTEAGAVAQFIEKRSVADTSDDVSVRISELSEKSSGRVFSFSEIEPGKSSDLKSASPIATQLAGALDVLAKTSRLDPIASPDGKPVPVALAMKTMTYRYELGFQRTAGGELGLTLGPIGVDFSTKSGSAASNILEVEIGR
jgi:hypothetical protein